MTIEKPIDISDLIPFQWADIIDAFGRMTGRDSYSHWSELGDSPVWRGISRDAWWAALKLCRSGQVRRLDFSDAKGRRFGFCLPALVVETLHELDRAAPEIKADLGARDRFSASGLVLEAVSSAMLAGSPCRVEVAEEMLRIGRDPQDDDERRIVNLHRALDEVRSRRASPLSPAFIADIHRLLTQGVSGEGDAAGRWRSDGEGSMSERAAPVPPAAGIPQRLEALCAFANARTPECFIHPVIRAIILHFWLAHDRPFAHANGRVARALFYWAMGHRRYEWIDLVSLSAAMARDPERYRHSFWETETDENDLTYFILAQLDAIRAAWADLHERLARTDAALSAAAGRLQGFEHLNVRQRAVMAHAFRHAEAVYVISGHQRSHGVTHQTARDDLFDLVRRELLTVTRERRVYHFRPAAERAGGVQSVGSRRRRVPPGIAAETLPTSLL